MWKCQNEEEEAEISRYALHINEYGQLASVSFDDETAQWILKSIFKMIIKCTYMENRHICDQSAKVLSSQSSCFWLI